LSNRAFAGPSQEQPHTWTLHNSAQSEAGADCETSGHIELSEDSDNKDNGNVTLSQQLIRNVADRAVGIKKAFSNGTVAPPDGEISNRTGNLFSLFTIVQFR
jgi:hypothetical protein